MDIIERAKKQGVSEQTIYELKRYDRDDKYLLEGLAKVDDFMYPYSISASPQTAGLFNWLEKLRVGKTKLGRRGKPTRFESRWALSLLAKVALTGEGISNRYEDRVARGEVPRYQDYSVGVELSEADRAQIVTKHVRLSENLLVTLNLPAGLNDTEASQLARSILSFPGTQAH